METKWGFTRMDINEFELWLSLLRIGRTVRTIQQHHTFSPAYIHFKQDNHFALQKGMKNYHVTHNGWSDIGQHFTSFPDGTILTGRKLEASPACIFGNNANSICIEHLGNFDQGGDRMTDLQQQAIVRMTAVLLKKFNLQPSVQTNVYHHWFNLSTGERNNGSKNNKSCPGTNFFGGNKVADCEKHFLPLVQSLLNPAVTFPVTAPVRYVSVASENLNIRSGPGPSNAIATDREPLQSGAILRIFDQQDNWLKITASAEHWVNAKFTKGVLQKSVSASSLNVRSGPSTDYPVIGSLLKGQEIFISAEENGWSKLSNDSRWVKSSHLT
ncbi:MAG TPA: SH3 domain-containing protein [Flavobacterium sp.]|jgi:uncharacterized protein YgiM (DUF1202 family)